MLDVSGPFHSPLMAAAKDEFGAALQAVDVQMPAVPIVQNVNADVPADVDELRSNLLAQIAEPVLWSKCVLRMVDLGVEQFAECGPGSVLGGLIRRISKGTPTVGLSNVDGIESLKD